MCARAGAFFLNEGVTLNQQNVLSVYFAFLAMMRYTFLICIQWNGVIQFIVFRFVFMRGIFCGLVQNML